MKRVGILGTGTIGAGWATLLVARGCEVRLFDEMPDCLARSTAMIESGIDFLCRSGLIVDRGLPSAIERVVVCSSLEEVLEGVDFIQESTIEDYEIKGRLYDQIEEVADSAVIVASSSSGLLASRLQAGRAHPERFVIGHPWNPPYLMPLVEVVPGRCTSFSTTDRACSFYRTLGMDPIVVRQEVPGYVGNRLAAALWREAIDLVDRGIATVEDVDRAVRSGPGLRWALTGVHLTYHLGGGEGGMEHFVDHLGPAFESWWADIADWSRMPKGAREKLETGVRSVASGSSYEDLVQRRDELLVALLSLNENRLDRNPLKQQGTAIPLEEAV